VDRRAGHHVERQLGVEPGRGLCRAAFDESSRRLDVLFVRTAADHRVDRGVADHGKERCSGLGAIEGVDRGAEHLERRRLTAASNSGSRSPTTASTARSALAILVPVAAGAAPAFTAPAAMVEGVHLF